MTQSPGTFVLVHGSWQGGWCWSRVAEILRAAGHRVFTPTLTGLGERSHLFSGAITLTTHIADVVNVLEWEDLTNVILCGHSYGGFVISGAAERMEHRLSSIVFLDAFLPNDGEAIVDVAAIHRTGLVDSAGRNGMGVPPFPASYFFSNEADRAYVDAKCVMQPIGTFLEKIQINGARDRIPRKTYIRATNYASTWFDEARRRCAADPAWEIHDLPCGHNVMLDLPDVLAELLAAHVTAA
jgi:pimeloyl-ACP methyl ester carboxylesterase